MPSAVGPLCAVVGLLILGATARILNACRKDGELAFAAGLCAVTLLSPLVWQHYLCLLLWPIWQLGRRLARAGWPRGSSRAFFVALALLSIPTQAVTLAALGASRAWPPAGAVVLLVLPIGSLILLGLVPRLATPGPRPAA